MYIQQLLDLKDVILSVVPVIANSMRITNNKITNSNNNYDIIYEQILKYSKTKLNWQYNRFCIGFRNEEEQQNYERLMDCCRLIMFQDTAKNAKLKTKNFMLKLANIKQNSSEPCSLFSAAIAKYGLLRQSVDSKRVFKSTRTVVTGDGNLNSDEVVLPLELAKQITVPLTINDVNITKCIEMINNQDQYPHIVKICQQGLIKHIVPENIKYILSTLKIGDIAYRQVIQGDVCLVNRYPSIREESFGCHKVIIKDVKTMQFNLQVVKKMTADFDGDEMQTYFMSSVSNNIEIALLSSMQRQLITYETGLNIIGGAPDLDAGMFLAKNLNKHKDLSDIIKKYIPTLNYSLNGILIKNSEIIEFDSSIANANSKFITWLQFYYGPTIAIKIMDEMTRYIYKLNEQYGSTLYSKIFTKYPDLYKQISYKNIDETNKIIKEYLQKDVFDQTEFNMKIINSVQKDQLKQVEQIYPLLKMDKQLFYNKLITKFQEQLRLGIINIGQVYDENNKLIEDPIRILPCYPKFSTDIRHKGYITGNYSTGLNQTEMFLDSISGRRQLYLKGNAVATDGYTARRITKGSMNVISGFNGIVYSDSQTIVSLQFGQSGYDPRCYQKITVNKKDIVQTQSNLILFKQIQDFQNQLYLNNPYLTLNQDQITFSLPFIPTYNDITKDELYSLLSCRICENMSEEFQKIQYQQSWYFWAYCHLMIPIVKRQNNFDIVQMYIKSFVSPGEMVGLKASHASSQPYTQSTLHSIHHVGKAQNEIQIERLKGADRFMELVTNTRGPIAVQFELLNGYDIKKFIQKNQSLYLSQLNPEYLLYFQNNQYFLEIKFDMKILALYDIYLQNIINLFDKFQIQNLEFKDNQVIIKISDDKEQSLMSFCQNNQFISSSELINLKLKNGSDKIIEGNIYIDKLKKKTQYLDKLYQIREINPNTLYCSNPKEYENLFGIEKCNQQLHMELYYNLQTEESTKEVQGVHVKLLTDVLTQTGKYKNFTSSSYKTQTHRDPTGNILFEQSSMFISEIIKKQLKYPADTIQCSVIYGSNAKAGSTYCNIYSNDYLYQQNIPKIKKQIEKQIKKQIEGVQK